MAGAPHTPTREARATQGPVQPKANEYASDQKPSTEGKEEKEEL